LTDSPSISARVATTPRIPLATLALLALLALAAAPAWGQRQRLGVSDERQLDQTYVTLWEQGEYRAALDEINTLLASSTPTSPQPIRTNLNQLRYDRAQLRFATGQVDEAIEDMLQVATRQPQPSFSLELALMYQYRGMPLPYDEWMQRAAQQTRSRDWYYRRRSENVAAVGRIAELMGTNPKTVLSGHFGQAYEVFPDLGAVVDIAAGDLAFRAQGFDIAEEYYLKALEKEPKNQEALAGLMEAYVRSMDRRAEEVIEKLAALNPNHPRLDAVLAARAIEKLDLAKAMEIIDKQLAINPVSHRFRALKAAAQFLGDDLDGMNKTIEAALEYSPIRSEVYRTIGTYASRHYRFTEAMEFQAKALEIDPKDHEARALYTLDLMRLGREDESKPELEAAFEADPYNVSLYNLLQLMGTLETFETIERGAFVLKLPKNEAPIMAEPALDLLDEALEIFEKKYQIDIEKPVLIEMFDNHDDFMVRSVGLPGNAGHLGICFGKLVTMDTPSVRPKGSSNWRTVLWHEFAHVITLQKTKNRMPRWLSEGISVYEEAQRGEAFHNRLDPQYLPILKEEGIPSLRAIDGFFTQPKSGMHMMYGYFTAGEFVDFYNTRYGLQAMVDALAAIATGKNAEEALVAAAKVDFETLDSEFHKHLEERFKPYDNLPQPPNQKGGLLQRLARTLIGGGTSAPEAPKPAPPSPFTDALKGAEEAAARGDDDAAETAWKRAYSLFPDYQGENAPLRKLALLYKTQGDDAKYVEALETLRNSSPQEFEATRALAQIYHERGDWKRVVEMTDWALGIDPYDPAYYRMLAEARIKRGEGPHALDALAALIHLDPGNMTDYRLQRAQILHDDKQWTDAKTEVVRILEDTPHFWDAQQLLLDIVEKGTAGAGR
jgi:tetratricopeptide (TPR) repeat protein